MPPQADRFEVLGADGVRLSALASGTGDAVPVLLVHGYPDTAAVWDPVARVLERRYRVIRYDARGAGASETPTGRSGYRVARLAADVRLVAAAACPGRQVHLVGHDWGAVTGWEAVTEPDAHSWAASYTSISGPCLDHVAHWTRDRLRARTARGAGELARQLAHSWYIAAFQLPVVPELAWRRVLGPGWARRLRGEGVPAAAARPASTLIDDAVHGLGLYRANRGAALGHRPRDRVAAVAVQLVVPRRDRYVTPALAGSAAGWASPLWRRHLDTGHWGALTSHAEETAGFVDSFIRHVRDGADLGPTAERIG